MKRMHRFFFEYLSFHDNLIYKNYREESMANSNNSEVTPDLTDQLTGFWTRKSLIKKLQQIDTEEDGALFSVWSVKIARFKNLNDGFGDELGDKVIKLISKRFTKMFPQNTHIGRMAGSNFCFVFEHNGNIESELEKLLEFSQRPILVGGEVVVLAINVGVSNSYNQHDQIEDLIHLAEVAQHNAIASTIKV